MYYDILLSSITITPQSYCLFITIILKYKHSSSTMLKKQQQPCVACSIMTMHSVAFFQPTACSFFTLPLL